MDALDAHTVSITSTHDLGHLIAGVSLEYFTREVVGCRHLHLERSDPSWFGNLLTIGDVLDAVTMVPVDDGAVTLSKTVDGEHHHRPAPTRPFEIRRAGSMRRERRIDRRDLLAALRDGSSVVVNDIGRLSPPVRRLCSILAAQLEAPVVANAYLSPAAAQGFDIHYDRHDALIIQLEGSKHWDLFDRVVDDPLEGFRDPIVDMSSPVRYRLVVQRGDSLYLPAGLAHRARSADQASLHLTLSWYPPRRHELWSAVLEHLALTDREIRSPLRSWDPLIEADRLRGALQSIAERDDLVEVVSAARSKLFSQWLAGEPEDVGFALGAGLDPLPPTTQWSSTKVMWRPGIPRHVEHTSLGAEVVVPGRVVRLPPDCTVFVERLSTEACTLDEVASGMEGSRAARVLEALVSCGAVVVIGE